MSGKRNRHGKSGNNASSASSGNNEDPNVLQCHGVYSDRMNLESKLYQAIITSSYYKGVLAEQLSCKGVVEEIFAKVYHLSPWVEMSACTKGKKPKEARVVSTAFCCLMKLHELKLNRRQLNAMIQSQDSPYIRGVGFLYIRFTQPPDKLWDWFREFLDDNREIDIKPGGGRYVTFGDMLRQILTERKWFSTEFPPIPHQVQVTINQGLQNREAAALPGLLGGPIQDRPPFPQDLSRITPDGGLPFPE